MSGVQQVVNDLLSLDDGEMSMTKSHVVGSLSHGHDRVEVAGSSSDRSRTSPSERGTAPREPRI
jgi:hypothetical protein